MSAYEERPWLALYGAGVPHEIEPEHESMLAVFSQTAARYPDKPAVQYFDTPISYRELDEITDALAFGLGAEGFARGDRAAVYLQNVPQFVIAMLATWKAGGIMVSVSPMLKHKELATQLMDSGATALITLESLWQDVAREVVPSDTDVRTVITTSELDFLDQAGVPPMLADARRARDDAALDLVEVVSRYHGKVCTTPVPGPDDSRS